MIGEGAFGQRRFEGGDDHPQVGIERGRRDAGEAKLLDGAGQRARQAGLGRDRTEAPELRGLSQLVHDADPDRLDRQRRGRSQPLLEQRRLGEPQGEASQREAVPAEGRSMLVGHFSGELVDAQRVGAQQQQLTIARLSLEPLQRALEAQSGG